MKHVLLLVCWSFATIYSVSLGASVSAHNLQVRVAARLNSRPLIFDSVIFTNDFGQALSVNRLDLLVADLAIRRMDGSWLEFPSTQGYASLRAGRSAFKVAGIPSGEYNRVRFHVGLPPALNHADPAQYAADHPLNPNVNGLHWSWQGGYVFLALEGHWLDEAGKQSGYSYHLATDAQLMTVELPSRLDLTSDCELRLVLDLDQVFGGGSEKIVFSEATQSTHSRANDPLASQLRRNVESAFAVEGIEAGLAPAPADGTARVEIAAGAKPYVLTISAFFPVPALPKDNPLTEEGVELGRRLFSDPLLSVNNAQSCASCHQAASGFSENKAVSIGAEGKTGKRNVMPLMNLAWKSAFFWDGRAASLREQVLQPIQNPIEMHETLIHIVSKLQRGRGQTTYPVLFEKAFGTREVTAERIARALEQFLLTQVSHDSKLDRVLRGEAKLTEQEQRGFELFHTEYDPRREQFGADCFHCHGGPLFQSQAFANNGLDAEFRDPGRYEVTKMEGDRGKFAVPSLRNVEVTGPYMHDGRFKTLEEVIEHYSRAVKRSATLDPNLAKHPDGGVPLSGADKQALIAFLKTLTDECYRSNPTPLVAKAEIRNPKSE